jgi:ADP-ribose pyrophosphatase
VSASGDGGFRHLSDELLQQGHIISMYRASFVAPDGSEFQREVVRHPGAVSVVPLLDSGEVVLVRQYRAALDRMLLEIPAGKRDVAGEPPEETARRELIEEVGLSPGTLRHLVTFNNSVGFSDEESHVFLGTDLTEAEQDRQGVEEQFMEIVRVRLVDTARMISSGEITDAKTVIGLTLARAAAEPSAQ